MADPLSVMASVIAVATLAWQSSKATYEIIDGLAGAPDAIARSRDVLSQTQTTINGLKETIVPGNNPVVFESVLRRVNLTAALQLITQLCDGFTTMIKDVTSHSTDAKFSKRDRLAVTFRESKIIKFNMQLGDCQRTLSVVLAAINLIVSSHMSEDMENLGDRFAAQEAKLIGLGRQLREKQLALVEAESDDCGSEQAIQVEPGLQKVCDEALSATRARRTGQSFGDMQTDGKSTAMQGIVGQAQSGVDQKFRNMTTTNGSKAFQGQMDSTSFSVLFGGS